MHMSIPTSNRSTLSNIKNYLIIGERLQNNLLALAFGITYLASLDFKYPLLKSNQKLSLVANYCGSASRAGFFIKSSCQQLFNFNLIIKFALLCLLRKDRSSSINNSILLFLIPLPSPFLLVRSVRSVANMFSNALILTVACNITFGVP